MKRVLFDRGGENEDYPFILTFRLAQDREDFS